MSTQNRVPAGRAYKASGRNNFHMIMTPTTHKRPRIALTRRARLNGAFAPISVYSGESEFAKLTRACASRRACQYHSRDYRHV